MFYVIKDNKLYEWSDKREFLDYPYEAKELIGISMAKFKIDKYKIIDGELKDISLSQEYIKKIENKQKEERIAQLKQELDKLDIKSIRAFREPEMMDDATNLTWLDYYQNKIFELRQELETLKKQ